MYKNKVVALSIICALSILLVVPFVKADTAVYAYNGTHFSATDNSLTSTVLHTMGLTAAGNGYAVTSASFYMKSASIGVTANSGKIQGVIYDTNGTWIENSTSIMNLAVTPIGYGGDPASFASYTVVSFTFSGTKNLLPSHSYDILFVTIEALNTNCAFAVGADAQYSGFSGVTTTAYPLANSAGLSKTLIGEVRYTGSYTSATPTPTPPDTTGAWMQSIAQVIVPLIMLLIPAFFGWKFAKAWGFFAGLNAGVILCYVFMNGAFPLWGVIMMLIVDGLLLFGKVGFRT